MNAYPFELLLAPVAKPLAASVTVPGSKSITNRALVLAALGDRPKTLLTGALQSEDTEVMVACLNELGFGIEPEWETASIVVYRSKSKVIPSSSAELFVGNSGTTVRFVTALAALGHGRYRLDGVPRMRERPIQDLLDAINALGANAFSEAGNGCPPVVIQSEGLKGGTVAIRADLSSQFLSALLMAAPRADSELLIRVEGPRVSEPYVEMTLDMLHAWGAEVESLADGYLAKVGFRDSPAEYAIEPDASAASYFWAAAAVTGGRVMVLRLTRDSLQGDVAFVDALEKMGCRIEECAEGIAVQGFSLKGIDIDMNAISDTAMTLAAVALFAEGPTTIRNIAHVRHKETDRIAAVAAELRKLGATVEEFDDGLRIVPGPLKGCSVATYDDHRMAMSLAIVGLKVPGVKIENPGCVAKTYPGFWQDWARMSE